MNELKEKLREFVREREWETFHTPKNLAMALSVETAELVEIFQWLTDEQARNLAPDKLQAAREEIGDILIYLTRLSDTLGIDPVDAAHNKLEKAKLKYPAEKVRGKSLKYNEYPAE